MRWRFLVVLLIYHCVSQQASVAQRNKLYVNGESVKTIGLDSQPRTYDTEINKLLVGFWERGYPFCRVIEQAVDTAIFIETGKNYSLLCKRILSEDSARLQRKVRNGESLFKTANATLNYLTNHGYPFAQVQLVNLAWVEKGYAGDLLVKKGPYIVYDTIQALSGDGYAPVYWSRFLRLRVGEPYCEEDFLSLEKRLGLAAHLVLKSPPDIAFSEGKAVVYLDVEERKANSFEGVLGLIPSQDNSLLVTGFLDLSLVNMAQTGRNLKVSWKKFAYQSQSLNLSYLHPYPLGVDVILGLQFDLLKQDSTFLTQEFNVNIGSYIGEVALLSFFYHRKIGKMIANEVELVLNEKVVDYNRDNYGLEIGFNNSGDPLLFGNGVQAKASISVARKTIQRNPNINQVYYDHLSQTSTQWMIEAQIDYQRIIKKQFALHHSLVYGAIHGNEVLQNEMFRLGGLKSMRGFNENIFFARYFGISRLEARQYFEQRSYFMLFHDQLFMRGRENFSYPTGLGLGFTLNTNSSLFSFAMALENQKVSHLILPDPPFILDTFLSFEVFFDLRYSFG